MLILDKAAAIKIRMDIKILSYVDADYRPSAWLAYMLTSKPTGNDAFVTPRLRVDECRSIGCNDFCMF